MKKEISLIKSLLIIFDTVLFFIALILVLFFRFGNNFIIYWGDHFLPFLFLLPFVLLLLNAFNFYDFYFFNFRILFLKFLLFIFWISVISIVYFYFGETIFNISPKTNLFVFLTIFSSFLLVIRFIFYKFFQKPQFIYFLGEEHLRQKLKKDLEGNRLFLYQDKDLDEKNTKNSILIVSPSYNFNQSEINKFLNLKISIFDYIDFYEKFLGRVPLEAVNFDWFIKEVYFGESDLYFYFKRMLDIFLALLFLSIFLLILIPIAILIFLNDPGPIFFVQQRVGYRGKIFKLIKFRTMKIANEVNNKWAVGEEEKRIFFIGKILRKTHLDELPQLINLLKGDISLVGPRPEQPEIFENLAKEINFYSLRNLVPAGITGWAQVNYKYPDNIEETKIKLEYDLYYLKNASLFLDILIIIKTFQKLFF